MIVQSAFGIVIFVVVAIAVVVAVVTLIGRSDAYDQIGRGGLSLNEDLGRGGPAAPSAPATSPAEREEEIRQMLTARNERRLRQGRAAVDVDSETARLLDVPRVDAGLAEEVRQLVIARNERRVRQGKAPLDVDAEVARQLRDLQV